MVSLRLTDIAALVDRGLTAHIETARPPKADPKDATVARLEADGSLFHEVFPVLRRDATMTCTLLGDDRRCRAYPDWPLSCARYPYALDALSGRVFLAEGCRSHRRIHLDDAPDAARRLIDAAIAGYNQRIKDVLLLHMELDALHALGLTRFLRLPKRLERKLRQPSRPR